MDAAWPQAETPNRTVLLRQCGALQGFSPRWVEAPLKGSMRQIKYLC